MIFLTRWARAGDFDFDARRERLLDAEKALKEFSRRFFGVAPAMASHFLEPLRQLVIADMPAPSDDDELQLQQLQQHLLGAGNKSALSVFQGGLIDGRLAVQVRRLAQLIESEKSELQHEAGIGFYAKARSAETGALQRAAGAGCRVYQLAHGLVPVPRKRGPLPDGPFDRFMMEVLAPVVEELRLNRPDKKYEWPSLIHYAKIARNKLPPQAP